MADTKPNWNNMVDITVPTGTNGWLYSGEVIINGIKVRFPVGTPTSVPEPAAVLLEKMIELEREEAGNGAMPDNHYIGSVTIPAGKTLTLEPGSKLVDNSGGASDVVILPETVTTVDPDNSEGAAVIATPLQSPVAAGDTVSITYNGTAYECTGVDGGTTNSRSVAFGNLAAMGATGGNPDAPFIVILAPDGIDDDGDGVIDNGA